MTTTATKDQICSVDLSNVDHLYNDAAGNLYYKVRGDDNADFEVLDGGFTLDEVKAAIAYGDAEFLYIAGPASVSIQRLKERESNENLQRLLKSIFKEGV